MAVTMIKSDLEFILAQIKIAEAHAAGQPLFGPGGLVPAYNTSFGLRTVDGTYNHLLPGQETWGSAGQQFPTLMPPVYRPADGTPLDFDGPGPAPAMPTAPNYNPSNNPGSFVVDSSLRTISNLIVDQTLGNPAAITTALERAGSTNAEADLADVTAIYQVFKPACRCGVSSPRRSDERRALQAERPRRWRSQHAALSLAEQAAIAEADAADADAHADAVAARDAAPRVATQTSSPTASSWKAITSVSPTFHPTWACPRRSTHGSRCSASSSITGSTSSTKAAAARCSFLCSPMIRCMSRAATPISWC